jgi:hypothetical protein
MFSLVRRQDKRKCAEYIGRCTFCSLRLLMCMAQTSRSSMTYDV